MSPAISTPTSGNIMGIEYFHGVKTLCVTFSGGSVYGYENIDREEVDALLLAPSIGAHFARTIRTRQYFRVNGQQLQDLRVEEQKRGDEPYKAPEPPTEGGATTAAVVES